MIKPGQCYEETFNIMMSDENIAKNGKIVHGTAQDPKTKKVINHAWIEVGTLVIDPTLFETPVRKAQYYKVMKAKPQKYYTDLQAINQVFKQKKGFCKW